LIEFSLIVFQPLSHHIPASLLLLLLLLLIVM